MMMAVIAAAGSACAPPNDGDVTLVVFAASSLSAVFEALAEDFERERGDVDVQISVAGSSSLREQILDGAPADVFAAANEAVMDELVAAGRAAATPTPFATNRLVVGVPAGNPGAVVDLRDLARQDLLVGLCATGVPCGDLARSVLTRAGVRPALDTEEPDVRALATKLAAGDLDVGLVYLTDALATDLIDRIEVADSQSVRYPIVVVDDAPAAVSAREFVAFVLSADGQNVLREFGFGAP